MKAFVIDRTCDLGKERLPLRQVEIPVPEPAEKELLIRVLACGVCHTEIDEIEGRTPPLQLPLIPGHQVVGEVVALGEGASRFREGDRVGVAWIFSACSDCEYCLSGRENLCHKFKATGRDVDGGYAEYMTASEDFVCSIPEDISDLEAAPLLCAGAIGYRALRLTALKDGQALGLTGFGASAHIVLKLSKYLFPASKVYVFARSEKERVFAMELGAAWAGDTEETPPVKMDAIIDTTPAWKPVVEAMRCLKGGGRLVVNAIGKEETDKDYLLKLNYPEHLWMEKEIKSVANLTRLDVSEFLKLAAQIPLRPEVEIYPFEGANEALLDLKKGSIRGGKVLKIR